VSPTGRKVLIVAGEREQLVSSGASMTWHDLVLYLILGSLPCSGTTPRAVHRISVAQGSQ
jgi:hypothetical protein